MSILCKILNSVVKGKTDFCCLCFSTDHNIIGLHDEIAVEINAVEQNIRVSDLMQSVISGELQKYLSTFENVCEICIKAIVNFHIFLKTSHGNATLLMEALNGLNNSFERNITVHTVQDVKEKHKSLFVTLNLENFTSEQVYDTKKFNSTSAALNRFQLLNTLNIKQEGSVTKGKNVDLQKNSKKKDTSTNIKISDMLYDPNDLSLFRCKECLKVYLSMWNLRFHFLRVHAPKVHKCTKCPKAFGSQSILDYHMNDSHCEIICSECGKTQRNRASLIRHEMGHHLKIICPDCGRSYKSKLTYKNHILFNVCKQECRAKPANAQFTCDYCNKKYTQKMSLRVHIQYEHGNYKGHVCDWCGKKFWAQSRLKAHIVKHTREKNFSCSVCCSKFVTKESLLYHTRLHTGEKPYKCSECECTFISSSRRAYHMKAYHLGATIQCDKCQCKFTSRTYLHKHMQFHREMTNNMANNTTRKHTPKIETNANKPTEKETRKQSVKNTTTTNKTSEKDCTNTEKLLTEKSLYQLNTDTTSLADENVLVANNSILNPGLDQNNTSEVVLVTAENGDEYFCTLTEFRTLV